VWIKRGSTVDADVPSQRMTIFFGSLSTSGSAIVARSRRGWELSGEMRLNVWYGEEYVEDGVRVLM
jgi:hypothetical protein